LRRSRGHLRREHGLGGLARLRIRPRDRVRLAHPAALADPGGRGVSGATSPAVELRGVWKEFVKGDRRVEAVQGIDLEIAPHSFTAILGPSGCGKSTLLNMVAGFEAPTRGEVRANGALVSSPSPKRAVVFQEPALFPWYSVYENVVFGPKTQGQSAQAYRPLAEKIIEQVGLKGFASHYPAELSGGMKQRVGIARVLAMQPELL